MVRERTAELVMEAHPELDVCRVRKLVGEPLLDVGRSALLRIVSMLVKLVRSVGDAGQGKREEESGTGTGKDTGTGMGTERDVGQLLPPKVTGWSAAFGNLFDGTSFTHGRRWNMSGGTSGYPAGNMIRISAALASKRPSGKGRPLRMTLLLPPSTASSKEMPFEERYSRSDSGRKLMPHLPSSSFCR